MGRTRFKGPIKSENGFEIGSGPSGFTAEVNTTVIDGDGNVSVPGALKLTLAGTATVSAETSWFKTAYASASLGTTLPSSDYTVLTEITGDPAEVGQVKVYDKATNGFKLTNTGSAAATINWAVVVPAT